MKSVINPPILEIINLKTPLPPPSNGVIDPQLTLMHSPAKSCPVSETRVSVSIALSGGQPYRSNVCECRHV